MKLSEASPEALRAYLEPNEEALALVHRALERESVVPLTFGPGSVDKQLDRGQRVRKALRLLQASALLAKQEGRPSDSAEFDLEMVRIGPAVARGGINLDAMIGIAYESTGIWNLSGLRDQLDAETCRKMIAGLLATEVLPEPLQVIFDRDRALGESSVNRKMRFSLRLFSGRMQQLRQPAEESLRLSLLRTEAWKQILVTDLAIRVYRLEHGRDPERLEELVPSLLKSVPLDPFSKKPLVYRPQGNTYLLYSVGPDRHDDGGMSMQAKTDHANGKGDYVLDPVPAR
jgi:hypothetical protein